MATACMDISDDRLEDPRLMKRRRVSDSPACDVLLVASNSSILKTWWLVDGDIVLEIDHNLLKLHKKRLQCSAVFSDMLRIPQPLQTDRIDGCPSVRLSGDTMVDWEVALRWMYNRDDFLKQAVTFSVLEGAVRISTKYDIADLREWGIRELASRWPVDVANMSLNALPHAAEAITLAQECHIPSILPSAFYALSVQKFHCGADGGRSHLILSPADLRRLIAGREALADALLRIVIDPLTETSCYNNAFCGQCAPRRAEYWRTRLTPDPKSPWGTWLIRELEGMLGDDAFINGLCADCVHAHLSTIRWRLGRLRGAIPSFFLL